MSGASTTDGALVGVLDGEASADASSQFRFAVDEERAGERLDVFLAALFPARSRSQLQKLIADGAVLVTGEGDGLRRRKASYAVREGDTVALTVPPDAPIDALPEDIPLDILYEDADLLVVNKPKGMVVHPAPGHASGTLVNAVLFHCGEHLSGIGGVLRPGIVHRIDRDTTGSLIVCKNDTAHRAVAEQLAVHSITRIYHALVLGRMPAQEGTVDAPIGRDARDRKRMAIVESGKRAVTHWRMLRYFPGDDISYVSCQLETGRTHQIRVHLSSIGHPVLGDPVYGGDGRRRFRNLAGQCLHAKTLSFTHPRTGTLVETDAPLPAYFTGLLETLS